MNPERRRSRRRPVLSTFSIFIVIPKKGIHRLMVHDISELGMGFDLDIEGEPAGDYPAQIGDTVDFRFYLNSTLFIPLSIQITRLEETSLKRRVGAEFKDLSSPNYNAFLNFLQLLDKIVDFVQIDSLSQTV